MGHLEKLLFFVDPGSEEMQLAGLKKWKCPVVWYVVCFSSYVLSFIQWASKQETKDQGFDILASLNLNVWDTSQIITDHLFSHPNSVGKIKGWQKSSVFAKFTYFKVYYYIMYKRCQPPHEPAKSPGTYVSC